jgi:hypothetical protein
VQRISPRGGRWTLLAGVVLAGLAAGYVVTIARLWAGKVPGLVAFRGELGQILNRTSHEMHVSRPPGRPEEFHLQSPTDPYVNLSIHTARASHSLKTS